MRTMKVQKLRNVKTPNRGTPQSAGLDFSNTTNATANYSGSSGQFVTSNNIPNVNATVYTPSGTVYPPVAATPTADGGSNIYRGAVFYLPTGADLDNVYVDVAAVPAVATTATIEITTIAITEKIFKNS